MLDGLLFIEIFLILVRLIFVSLFCSLSFTFFLPYIYMITVNLFDDHEVHLHIC